MGMWDTINAINAGDKDHKPTEYVPFVVNKAFSYFADTVLYANDMNMLAHLDKDMQYAYFINTIRPRKRFSKWSKVAESDVIQAISTYYDMSYAKAKEVVKLHSEQQLKEIVERVTKGG